MASYYVNNLREYCNKIKSWNEKTYTELFLKAIFESVITFKKYTKFH